MGTYGTLCGTDLLTGRSTTCNLYQIGAHDGHGRMGSNHFKPKNRKPGTQLVSWFSPNSGLESRGQRLIGQIYFGTDDKGLDTKDIEVLDSLAKWITDHRLKGNPGCKLWFSGYADPSGAASYNERLSLKRAQVVQAHVEKAMQSGARTLAGLFYSSIANGFGETHPSGDKATDRRVDILDITPGVRPEQSQAFPPVIVNGERPRQWASGTLQFRTHISVSADILVVGVQEVIMEVRNPTSGYSAFYLFDGATLGFSPLPVGISAESTYTDYTFPPGLIDIDSFAGPGVILGAGVISGITFYHFLGAGTQHLKLVTQANQRGFTYVSTGQGLEIGISGATGVWTRIPGVANSDQLKAWMDQRAAKKDGAKKAIPSPIRRGTL